MLSKESKCFNVSDGDTARRLRGVFIPCEASNHLILNMQTEMYSPVLNGRQHRRFGKVA